MIFFAHPGGVGRLSVVSSWLILFHSSNKVSELCKEQQTLNNFTNVNLNVEEKEYHK